ncbi:unnamed protein product [Ilex paraguariensis]|uniref:Transcription repressor n=1 Tax=Ilex paraguariensis TaxID=185542 RepID=A0ABC8S1K2_9AQUA
MAKRFKLRISRVIPSFQSCRSKDPSSLPEDPVPSFFRLSPVNPKLIPVDFPRTPPPSKPQPHRSSFKRHVSSAFLSVGCGLTLKSGVQNSCDDNHTGSQQYFKWQKEEKWHVVAKVHDETPRRKIYNSSVSGDSDDEVLALPPPPLPPAAQKKKRRCRKKKTIMRGRMSTSSADSGLFSSEGADEEEEGEETETLVSSSRSFSTDSSSEFNPHLETIRETPMTTRRPKKNRKKAKKSKRSFSKAGGDGNGGYGPVKVKVMCRSSVSSSENASPARLSMFKKLIPCTVDGKVKESFAIVKKSDDPYEDFKRSMMEMILEKQMFEKEDLEQLLQCFLSLNSRHHHGVIVEAFSEIWETMFCAC